MGGWGMAVEILLAKACYGNWNKLGPNGPVGLHTDLMPCLHSTMSTVKFCSSFSLPTVPNTTANIDFDAYSVFPFPR